MSWAAVANTAKGIIAGAAAEAASTAGRTTGARLFGASSKILRSRARRDQQYLTDMQEESNKRLFAWTSDYAEETEVGTAEANEAEAEVADGVSAPEENAARIGFKPAALRSATFL